MWHKAEWMGRPMKLELTRVGLLVELANCYTTRGPQYIWPIDETPNVLSFRFIIDLGVMVKKKKENIHNMKPEFETISLVSSLDISSI